MDWNPLSWAWDLFGSAAGNTEQELLGGIAAIALQLACVGAGLALIVAGAWSLMSPQGVKSAAPIVMAAAA